MQPRGWTWYERNGRHHPTPRLARGTAQPATEQPSGAPRRITQARVGFAKEPWGEAEWTSRDIA